MSIVLQLEKPSQIIGIDLGNEHSTYVQVLVGKYGCKEEDFQEILLASSFMTPRESRDSSNRNRVRCFGSDALIQPVIGGKWDLVKILCTQPYNRHVQYGLSFIKLHAPAVAVTEEKSSKVAPTESTTSSAKLPTIKQLGLFKMREDSPESDGESRGSNPLFQRWKNEKLNSSLSAATAMSSPLSSSSTGTTPKAAAAIREASTPVSLKNHRNSINNTKVVKPNGPLMIADSDDEEDDTRVDRNRDKILYNDEDDAPNQKLEKKIAGDFARKSYVDNKIDTSEKMKSSSSKFKEFIDLDVTVESEPPKEKKTSAFYPKLSSPAVVRSPSSSSSSLFKKHSSSPASSSSSTNTLRLPTKKRPSSPLTNENKKPKINVIYRPFNKLLDGVIYVISGIQNPERATLREKASKLGARYKPDWDDSCTHLVCAFANTPKHRQVMGLGKIVKRDWIPKCYELKKKVPWRLYALDSDDASFPDSDEEILDVSLKPAEASSSSSSPTQPPKLSTVAVKKKYEDDDDEDVVMQYDIDEKVHSIDDGSDSGSDTEDEIEKLQKAENNNKPSLADANYDKSTDDELELASQKSTQSTDFFKDKKFFLSSELGAVDLIKLKRFIEVHSGDILDEHVNADYVISNKKHQSEYRGVVVKPLWIYECNDMDCLLPIKRYQL